MLEGIGNGSIRCVAVDTPVPSVFSHEILNANPYAFLDDAPLEERRARAVEMRRVLPESVLREVGGLDQDAVREVRRQAWPDVRDADDLHDALLTLLVVPQRDSGRRRTRRWPAGSGSRCQPGNPLFAELEQTRRAGRAIVGDRVYWVATEQAKACSRSCRTPRFERALPDLPYTATSETEVLVALVQGWMSHSGPVTAAELGAVLGIGNGARR